MDNDKICPLIQESKYIRDLEDFMCKREDCAWWIEDKQKCAVAVLGGLKFK